MKTSIVAIQHIQVYTNTPSIQSRLNILIQWANEHGHLEYFSQITKAILKIRNNNNENGNNFDFKQTSIDDLKLSFYIYLIGVVISLICFICELLLLFCDCCR